MSKTKANMKKLIEQRDQLLAEMEALRNKIAGLEMAISLIDNDAPLSVSTAGKKRQSNVKSTLLDLLTESGTTGLNASTAVEIAERRGISLDRGTISSLLSRLKKDEVVQYDGEKYRLTQFATSSQQSVFN